MKIQTLFKYIPDGWANRLTNFFTQNESVSHWNNHLLGLSSLEIYTIIDIGANEGQSTQKLGRIFPKATIYAFEPCLSAYQKLVRIGEKNPQIIPYNMALGESQNQVIFREFSQATQASSVLEIYPSTLREYPILEKVNYREIEQCPLDEISLPIIPHLLVKIDVQGYELQVIKGGIHTLQQTKACIIEINNDLTYNQQSSFKEIFSILSDLGFNFLGNLSQYYAKDGHIKYFDAVFLRP